MAKKIKFGPGILVTAAFIGPGTITTCTVAGASFGYALLWALVFSVLATIVLQEMAARLGIVTRRGLGEAIGRHFTNRLAKIFAVLLVFTAITVGNAAFETGNLLGAAVGLETVSKALELKINFWVVVVAISAFLILFAGSYKLIEKVLITLVILMSLAFLSTAIMVVPSLKELVQGIWKISLEKKSLLTITGLIGTTVVPYNLFCMLQQFRRSGAMPETCRQQGWISVCLLF